MYNNFQEFFTNNWHSQFVVIILNVRTSFYELVVLGVTKKSDLLGETNAGDKFR